MMKLLRPIVVAAVSRRAIVSVAIGLGLTLAGCSTPPGSPSPKPIARVAVTVSSVTKATIAPETFGYTFALHFAESGGVATTVTEVDVEFDGNLNSAALIGDQLGANRRLTANGTLDLELTCVPGWGYMVQHEEYATVTVYLTDDNGNRGRAIASIVKL